MESNDKDTKDDVRQRKKSEQSNSSSESEIVMVHGKKIKKEKPPGSRSKWSTSNEIERLLWIILVPLRALLCFSNVTIFFVTYFGFMITVLWAKKLWPRFYWFYEGKLYVCHLLNTLYSRFRCGCKVSLATGVIPLVTQAFRFKTLI